MKRVPIPLIAALILVVGAIMFYFRVYTPPLVWTDIENGSVVGIVSGAKPTFLVASTVPIQLIFNDTVPIYYTRVPIGIIYAPNGFKASANTSYGYIFPPNSDFPKDAHLSYNVKDYGWVFLYFANFTDKFWVPNLGCNKDRQVYRIVTEPDGYAHMIACNAYLNANMTLDTIVTPHMSTWPHTVANTITLQPAREILWHDLAVYWAYVVVLDTNKTVTVTIKYA